MTGAHRFPILRRMAAWRMHRVGKHLIPGFLIVYVLIAGTNLIFGFRAGEIFPFFAWTLFSHTPERIKLQPAILLHTIDGAPAPVARYLLPDASGGDRASLQRVSAECGFRQPRRARLLPALAAGLERNPARAGAVSDRCDALVTRIAAPIVERLAGPRTEFSIVLLRIDLHDVGADLDRLAAGASTRAGHYRLDRVLGRWTTAGL